MEVMPNLSPRRLELLDYATILLAYHSFSKIEKVIWNAKKANNLVA